MSKINKDLIKKWRKNIIYSVVSFLVLLIGIIANNEVAWVISFGLLFLITLLIYFSKRTFRLFNIFSRLFIIGINTFIAWIFTLSFDNTKSSELKETVNNNNWVFFVLGGIFWASIIVALIAFFLSDKEIKLLKIDVEDFKEMALIVASQIIMLIIVVLLIATKKYSSSLWVCLAYVPFIEAAFLPQTCLKWRKNYKER